MALIGNTSGCKDYEQFDQGENTVITFLCLFIDMGEITEKNYQEFYARTMLWEGEFGALAEGGTHLKLENIKKYIGFTANVKTTTRKQFEKRWGRAGHEATPSADCCSRGLTLPGCPASAGYSGVWGHRAITAHEVCT